MSFKRNDVQEYIENKCGCTDISKWNSYRQKLTELNLTISDISLLKQKSIVDSTSYWLKALHSFTQAIKGISMGYSAWSIVKLYYTTFYCLRSELLLNSILLIRNGRLFILNLSKETAFTPFTKSNIRGDHQLTIAYYYKLVSENEISDFLSSNSIDDDLPYIWLLKQRERVNYQMQFFPDPQIDPLLLKPFQYISNGELSKLFELVENSPNEIRYFDKDYSAIAIPYYKLKLISRYLKGHQIINNSNIAEINHVKNFLKQLNLTEDIISNLIFI